MDMTGSERIAAPRERVYEALNDPEVLKAAIPGCESIEKSSDTEMTATVVTKVGPVKAKFQGAVTLSDLDPPNGYTITGEGKGGPAGFAKGGADIITVHADAGPHLHRSLQAIRALGKKAGVALNPATPVSAIQHVIDDCDLVLIMSVNPGFGGQSFIPESLNKIAQAKALIGGRDIDLEVDGGVTADNARAIVAAGANVLVAGSAIYAGNDPTTYAGRIKAIRDAATGMVV